jgi:hypothetical protein
MDSTLDIPFLDIPPTPLTPPRYFISAILRRSTRGNGGYYNLAPRTIRIFEDIDSVTHFPSEEPAAIAIRTKWATRLKEIVQPLDHEDTQDITDGTSIKSDADAITQACQSAALIFWYLFLDDEYVGPFCMNFLQRLVQKLRYALCRGSMDTWVRTSPEAQIWICLLGTAAALDLNDRVWFSLRHGQPVICVESKGASVFLQSWSMYSWANQRRKERLMGAKEDDVLPRERLARGS